MIKLIVSDMDGTLVNDAKQIDAEIYTLLPLLRERGIRFVVASGRQFPSLRRDFHAHAAEVVLIAENGALIMDDEKELYARCMTREEIALCLDAVLAFSGLEPILCAKRTTYTRSAEMKAFLEAPQFHYTMTLAEDLYHVADDIIKISIIVTDGTDSAVYYDRLRPVLDARMNLVTSGEGCLDTGLYGVNKGTAVAALQALWGITPEETMAFGDQYNDIEMFTRAAHSFAMAGAAAGVKKKARFLAGSNNEGGVVREIRRALGLSAPKES